MEVQALLDGMNAHGHHIDEETLERIVATNAKRRYSFDASHTRIRANQGHSLDVDLELTPRVPPAVLFHGTADRFLDSIEREGLTSQQRQHVHLSADGSTAMTVGQRHGRPVVLQVDTAAMAADGFTFWVSTNGVWLCDAVPWKYITVEH